MMQGRRCVPPFGPILVVLLAGCHAQAAPESETLSPPSAELAVAFDPAQTGTLSGTVRWEGDVPDLAPLRFFASSTQLGSTHAHPFAPQVDPASGGLREAVVFLRGVELRRARPWHHGPVRVELYQREMHLLEDGQTVQTGFVRRGTEIEAVSRDGEYYGVRGRGAVFFGLPLPDVGVVTRRRVSQVGDVELTSATNFYWTHAHLLVDDHPYYVRTDAQGRFCLEQVPAGEYEVVCWLPSWVALKKERDPESGAVSRLLLAPPRQQRQTVRVEAGQVHHADFTWSRQRVEAKAE